MPPAEVAVAVLSRATAPWRRSSGGRARRGRSAPSASRPRAAAGRRWARPAGAARIARQSPRRLGEDAAAGSAEDGQAGRTRAGTSRPRGGPAGARAPAPTGRTNRAAGRAAYFAAMLCSMGRNGTASDRRCKRRRAGRSAASGVSAPRASARRDLALARRRGRAATTSGAWARERPRGGPRACRRRRGSSGRSGPRAMPERPGVAERLLDQRPVDRERARLVEARRPGPARRSRRAARRSRPPRGPRRRGRPASRRARAGPACAPRASAIRASSAASWSSPSIATVAPWSAATARSVSAKATSGWNDPTCVPAAMRRLEDLGAEQRRWCGPSPGRRTCGAPPATPAIASSGTARMISSTSSRSGRRLGEGADARDERSEPLAPRRRRGSRPPWTGQPARSSATPSAVPTAPAPTIPMTGGSPGSRPDVGVGVVAARGRRRRGGGGRSGPGRGRCRRLDLVDRLGRRRRRRRRPAGRGPSAVRLGGRRARPSSAAGPARRAPRGTLPRDECTDRADGGRVPSSLDRSLRRPRAASAPGLPDHCRLAALGDRIDLDRAPVTLKILLENVLRHAGGGIVRADGRRDARRRGGPGAPAEAEVPFMPARVILQDFTGVPAVVDLAVDARRDGRPRRRPRAGQPARPGRPRHRPLGPGRPVRDAGRVRLQRRARVRAQRRALPAPALGPDRVPRPAGRAARAPASSTRSTSSSSRRS